MEIDIDESDRDSSSGSHAEKLSGSATSRRRKGKEKKNPSNRLSTEEIVQQCHKVLNKVFGHPEYKGKQKDIIEAAVSSKDVLVIAPTGLGKSLCFQIPAIAVEQGVTIVISPLLALIKNQVSKLTSLRVQVVALTSENTPEEKQRVADDLRSGYPTYRLLYVTPEKLCTPEFADLLDAVHENKQLNRLVVDEAHCISEWGHDFRTEYRRLGTFRDRYPDVPIMALTASATAHVQNDIVQSLKMSSENTFHAIHPFNRPNLFYEVRYLSGSSYGKQMDDIRDFISTLHKRRGKPSCGIIYCRLRNMCNELASFLRGKGINARPYHKGLKPAVLDRTMEQWQQGSSEYEGGVDVVVATIAFGCGIDKSDVRYVIHFDLPKSLEGYYQETGRAGRDGSPARCVLYYSREDALKVKKLVASSFKSRQVKALLHDGPEPTQRTLDSFTSLLNLAESTSACRHVSICKYFGEAVDASDTSEYCNNMCDVCKYPEKTRERHQELSSAELLSALMSGPSEEPIDLDMDDCSAVRNKGPPMNDGFLPKKQKQVGEKRPALQDRVLLKKPKLGPKLKGPLPTIRLADTLKKPFKTPFKDITPSIDAIDLPEQCDTKASEDENEVIVIDDSSEPMQQDEPAEEDVVEEDAYRAIEKLPIERKSSPLLEQASESDEEVELEASYSQKVPSATRLKVFASIRKTLQGVFRILDEGLLKELLDSEDVCERLKSNAIAAFSKELEFGLYAYSATKQGYEERSESQLVYLKMLTASRFWWEQYAPIDDEEEESLFYLKMIRGVAQRMKNTMRK